MRLLAEVLSESTLSTLEPLRLNKNVSWRRELQSAPLTKDLFYDNQDWADEIDEDSRIDAQERLTAVECYESIMIVDQG
jgi:hypothetical protein